MNTIVSLQTESYDAYLPDVLPLYARHWEEVCWRRDKFSLSPDHARYRALEASGALRIYTAREEGIIVGYALFVIAQHLHYKEVKVANNDIFFVAPERRGAWLGVKLLKYARDALKAEGVQAWSLRMKKNLSWDAIANRVGLEEVDRVFLGYIGD